MNKLLLLFAAGLLANQAGQAQTVENLIVDGSNTWNATPIAGGSASITFNSAWAEFKLISSDITKTEYKGFKVEFSDLKEVTSGNVHLKIGKPVMEGEEDKGVYKYFNLADAADGVMSGDFAEELDDAITTLNVQCSAEGESVTITKFTLVKADGTEVEQESLGGSVWGCSAKQDVKGVTFTGQYGYEKILAADGSALTYDPVAEKNVVYTYNIEFEEALANTLIFEVDKKKADGSDDGMNWNNVAKGATSATFEVSAAKCAEAVTNIYVKADAKDGYPFTVKFKSITRTKVVNRDKTPDETKNKYVLPLVNGQVILASELEKFEDNDLVVFNYSCTWDDASVSFNGWGIAGLRNPEDKGTDVVSLKAGSKSGDYQYVTFIDELKAIAGHHAAEAEGENADTQEWDGIYYFSWGTKNGDVECTTTKGDIVVYTDKTIEQPETALPSVSAADVVSTEYISLSGAVSATPARGINIVKQTHSDGTVSHVKVVVK